MSIRFMSIRLKIFDINKNIGNCICSIEEYNNKGNIYFFNKKTYEVSDSYYAIDDQKRSFIDENDKLFVPLPQIVSEDRYRDLLDEINNEEVNMYFKKATSKEDLSFRYRVFVDENGLALALTESYKTKCSAAEILKEWCIENDIRYALRKIKKPIKKYYIADYSKVQDWVIPSERYFY